jgi:hypothetical protein
MEFVSRRHLRKEAFRSTRLWDSAHGDRANFLTLAERLRSLAGPAARNVMSRKTVMPARSSATPYSPAFLRPRRQMSTPPRFDALVAFRPLLDSLV